MQPRRRRALGLLGSVLTGLLWYAAGEPLGFGPLAWVALVPLFLAVFGERRWRWCFLYGLASGLVYFALHLSWIFIFGWMAFVGLVIVMALYIGLAGLFAGIARRWPLAPVLFAGAWAGAELLRDRWPFGGYPWGALGTTQGGVPGVRWLAGTIGVYGLSFLAAFAAALIADAVRAKRPAWGSLALVVSVLGLFVVADVVQFRGAPAGDTLRLAVVQGNVPRPARFDQRDRILANHIRLTRALPEVDLIVWPEDSMGIGVSEGAEERVQGLARELNTPMLVGRSLVRGNGFINTMEAIGPDGRVVGVYEKRHPVPFGEYVPVGFLRRFVGTLEQIPLDLRSGREPVAFPVAGTKVGTPICFESVFGRDIRDFVRRGAELIVVATNNASFERSAASQQHVAHTRMRALEMRQWTVQAALVGISAVISPDGTQSHTTELFTPATIVTDVRARPAPSLYAKVGDLFPQGWAAGTAAAVLLYAAAVATGRRRRRSDERALASVP
jgi:apolipoprotein N-acyltransferase